MTEAISDELMSRTLCRYAALARHVLEDPATWMAEDPEQDGAPGRSRLGKIVEGAKDLVTGRVHPGSPEWNDLPAQRRTRWWIARIQAVAAPVAGTPRVFGVAADRLPLQAAFGTAVAGLGVCAAAREHGVRDPANWVPLLGNVLFDRNVPRPGAVGPVPEDDDAPPPAQLGPVRRGTQAVWRLGRILWEMRDVFDRRPRGAWVLRAAGKVPLVGLVAGVLDERGAVSRAAEETVALLASPAGAARPDGGSDHSA